MLGPNGLNIGRQSSDETDLDQVRKADTMAMFILGLNALRLFPFHPATMQTDLYCLRT